MAQVTITINSREYAVACGDGQEAHIIKLSRMLDEKAKMLTAGGGHINENMLLAMVGLLLADDLSEAKKSTLAQTTHASESNLNERKEEAVKVVTKTIEKIVEKPIEPDLTPLDAELAETLLNVAQQIDAVTAELEKL